MVALAPLFWQIEPFFYCKLLWSQDQSTQNHQGNPNDAETAPFEIPTLRSNNFSPMNRITLLNSTWKREQGLGCELSARREELGSVEEKKGKDGTKVIDL